MQDNPNYTSNLLVSTGRILLSESPGKAQYSQHWMNQCFPDTEKKHDKISFGYGCWFSRTSWSLLAANACTPLLLQQEVPHSLPIEHRCSCGVDQVLSKSNKHILSLKQGKIPIRVGKSKTSFVDSLSLTRNNLGPRCMFTLPSWG